ncbi:hypothetical protein PybrP1_010681 [[Pythium] brassicae (nom. inval.)]|nr:hypothetical protein PybrP1_010681 [[Pythium] brassicae (nom. inval.)]
MRWQDTDVVRVAFAEPLLEDALSAYFASPAAAQLLDVREVAFSMELDKAARSSFLLLFRVPTDPTAGNQSTDTLADFLESYSTGDIAATTATDIFSSSTLLTFKWVAESVIQALAPFAALAPVPAPSATESFLVLRVAYRNIVSPANLTQGMIYQTRQGIARFLTLPSIADVYASGPPAAPAHSVLQVTQSYYLVLRTASAATLELRETLANLLVYGDPTRQIDDYESNDGYFATRRPAMFLDFVLPAQSVAPASLPAAETAAQIAMLDARLSYAFGSVAVEQFPAGNPPTPAPTAPTVAVPATPIEALLGKMRKRQRFRYDAATFASSAPRFPATVTYPSAATMYQANAASACTMSSGYCTYVYWKNSVESAFWLESIESVHRVAWNLFPTTPFFASPDPPPTEVAPVVAPGSTTTPIWTFGALSGPTNRLDFGLNFRSVSDNVTALKVEISTDVLSGADATSTVTSIARDTSGSATPVYETKSNVVVSYESRFRNGNELFLFLDIQASAVTEADTSQPCAHCQRLYDQCQSQPKCAALASCVFLEGIDADRIPYAMLQSSPLQDVREVGPYFRKCMPDAVDLRAMLVLASAVRCQMQRLCPFRTSAYYGASSDDRILVWESVPGRQQLTTAPANAHFSGSAAVNVSLRLGDQVLCYLPVLATTTGETLQEAITRTCDLARYLGYVSVSVSMTGSSGSTAAASASSYDTVDIRYKYVVGPLPTLEVVPPTAGSAAPAVEVATLALPGVRLRLEKLGFQSVLPPAPTRAAPDPCAKCNDLALNACLRDASCAAYTDCVMRHTSTSPPDTTTAAPGPALGDTILEAFRDQAVGAQIAFAGAVAACHSTADVNLLAWRKLVNASACFSATACPVSLRMLVPSSTGVVGRWRLSPAQTSQTLRYQQQALSPTPVSPRVPLALVRGSKVVQTDSSSLDPVELQAKLQQLLGYAAISAQVDFDRGDGVVELRSIQWTVTYSDWIGQLPRFLPESVSDWTLETDPSAPAARLYLEIASSASVAAGTVSLSATAEVVP